MKIGEYLLMEWKRESVSTRKMLDSVPADRLSWKPHEKNRTLGELALHVASIPKRFIPVFESGSFDPMQHKQPALESKEEMLREFDEGSDELMRRLESTDESEYDKGWAFAMNGKVVFEMPKAMALRTMLFDHLIHHRAQLSVYLRLLDVPVPGAYGPSADER